jgi:hypothetical protein
MTGSGAALFPELWTRQGEVIADSRGENAEMLKR